MKARIQFGSRGIDVEVMSQEEIARIGAPICAVPVAMASKPYDIHYVVGTRAGFPCVLCNQDCILAPSGQQQHSMGNPILCLDCLGAMHNAKSA